MKRTLTTKNIILIALLSALYLILTLISVPLSSLLGAFGHSISPGISGLLSGAILIFMSRKVGKMWQFTIMVAILMTVTAAMRAVYLPWLVTSVLGAILADVIASREEKPSLGRLAAASVSIHSGNALGGILFARQLYDEWVRHGQTPEHLPEMIQAAQGIMAVLGIVIPSLLSVLGIYLGWAMLRKHLERT